MATRVEILKHLHSDDDITVSCWNIMGSARATYRKEVTTATFQSSTKLGKADIICVQEMSFNPERKDRGKRLSVQKEYLPFLDTHCVGNIQREPGHNGKRNGIFYKKGKLEECEFEKALHDPINRACKLMEDKKKSKDSESLRKVLERRMGLCCLRIVGFDRIIVVASIHNYSKRSGRHRPLEFAHLFFDFFAELDVPAVIAGDFNLDKEALQKYSHFWPKIKLVPSKKAPRTKRIDFILAKDGEDVETRFDTLKEHDLEVSARTRKTLKHTKKIITNHNPLSATIHMEK
jgi:endonuclease/exonuclease/phosphatase family metal-dependent hydrolase